MAVIESPPEASIADDPSVHAVSHRPPTGFAGWLGSGDHKVIGRAYIAVSLLFGLAAVITGELVAIEQIDTSRFNILSSDTATQVFRFHSVTAVFLVLVPLTIGLAMVVVPLQVGAATIAFPRAAAASFWTWLIAGSLVVISYAINGGPGGGRATGVDLWIVALAGVLIALVTAAGCLIATVIGLRAPGMSLDRVPMFAWSMLVTCAMWLLTLPVLVGLLALMYVDHKHGRVSFGNNTSMYSRILWAFRHPEVYAFAIPVLGFAGDVLTVSARARQAFRGVVMGAIAAFGALGFGAFVQLSVYGDAVKQPTYVGMSLLAVLPVVVLVGLWADLFRRGRFSFSVPLVFAVSAVLLLLAGLVAGAAGAISALEVASDQPWEAAITHDVTLAALIGIVGGLHWWATKVFGRPAGRGLGVISGLSLLLGTVLLAVPGLASALVQAHSNDSHKGLFQALSTVQALGGGLVAVGVLAAVGSLIPAMRRRSAGDDDPRLGDPWEGHTLEWLTPSPPPLENFVVALPTVGSAEPLLDQREEAST